VRRSAKGALLGFVACAAVVAVAAQTRRAQQIRRPLGYTPSAFAAETALERRFRDGVSSARLSAYHAALTTRPHMAGSDGARVAAESIKTMLTAAGLDVEVLEYRVHLSTPREIAVALVSPVAQPLRVTEPASSLDPATRHPELGPGFVAYSASGDVTAPVVYANYGLPADYAQLTARGVDVRGKIVIARYGRSHRAVKLYTAEQAGALGLIIYSDPADDGFARGDTWPRGFWRTSEQLQRGNAKYSWFWHGDALTPGAPALANASRLDPATAPTLPRIPAAVLSWGEARRILERLDGDTVPPAFKGALPISYRFGGRAVRVHLRVQMDAGLRTIRDVIARVPGAQRPDRGVLLGTHHDAWTFGGVDPGSGTATLLEVARGLGALRRAGWRPQRTISFAFWDAEEFGLIGSTEFAEHRQRELRDGTVCYINTDLYTAGRLDVARDVPDTVGSMYDLWRADEWSRQTAERRARPMSDFEVELKALGSGADFVPFQDFLGLPTLSIELNATGGYSYGAYHSNYDTRWFAEHVADPGFVRGAQLARLLGTVALRLGESQVLPFRFSHYAQRLADYSLAAARWPVGADGRATMMLDLAPLDAAIARVAARAAALEQLVDDGLVTARLPSSSTARLNDVLARLEQRLLDESEPASRRWFRHVVYGWDIYSLYDGQPFPRLAEAVRLRDAARARRDLERITTAVDRLGAGLDEAIALAR
jgi:N-acetylated-alpha-linked acidic dipeptidase